MKIVKLFFLNLSFFGFILYFSSCETVVDIDIPDREPKLVLNSVVSTDQRFEGNVSLSRFILADEPFQKVEMAEVSLYESNRLLQSTFTNRKGDFTFDLQAKPGRQYTIIVDKEDYPSIEATALIPRQVNIQSIEIDSIALENMLAQEEHCADTLTPEQTLKLLQSNTEFVLHFQDQPGESNFYGVSARIRARVKEKIQQEDGRRKDTVIVLDFAARMETLDPALSSDDKLNIESEPYQDDEFLFNDRIFDGESYGFTFKINGNDLSPQGKVLDLNIYFRLKSISEEHYLYTKSKETQDENEGNPFAEPAPVYNNIQNGFGIFAGYSVHTTIFPEQSANN